MSLLAKIVERINTTEKKHEDYKQEQQEQVADEEKFVSERYSWTWLKKMSDATGFEISDNPVRVTNILNKLEKRDGHCPCGGMTEDFLCPCKMMRTYGKCKCGLYNSVSVLDPQCGKSEAKIKE